MYCIPGNFRIFLFTQILQILLSREIKFRENIAMPLLYVATWIIRDIIFREIIEIAIFTKI